MDKNTSPEKKFSAGAVSATIWKNATTRKDGNLAEFSTISLQRSYKDAAGNWQNASSLRLNDIPKAGLVLQKAYEYLTYKGDIAE